MIHVGRSLAALTTLVLMPVGAAMADVELDPTIRFREVSSQWGIDFRHHHGGSGARYNVETIAAGVVVFDFDGDGDDDVFFIDGAELPGYQGERPRSKLFRNDGGEFIEFTDRAGLGVRGYGAGATAGDLDNDGDLDLFVTCLRDNELWRNEGDGTFREATHDLPPTDPYWSTSSAFSDVDRDGDLDLYVANYIDAQIDNEEPCADRGIPIYCHPGTYTGLPDVFYRNAGQGKLEIASLSAGLVPGEHMAGLGVIFGDLDNDGWPDLYVANDSEPNFLFHNQGDGTFEEVGFLWGTAISERGMVEAGMGVDLGDVDGDGFLDIVVTNFARETNALYKNTGRQAFIDSRFPLNIAESSLLYLAFGVAFVDLDHDTDLDLIIANGHVMDNAELFPGGITSAQRNQVLVNSGVGRFEERSDVGLDVVRRSRGLAAGDLDLDGDLDVVINNINDQAEIYENVAANGAGFWLQVNLSGRASNRFGIDSRLDLGLGDRRLAREVRTASSFLSQNSSTVHFGIGDLVTVGPLEVRWSKGKKQRFVQLSANRRVQLYE